MIPSTRVGAILALAYALLGCSAGGASSASSDVGGLESTSSTPATTTGAASSGGPTRGSRVDLDAAELESREGARATGKGVRARGARAGVHLPEGWSPAAGNRFVRARSPRPDSAGSLLVRVDFGTDEDVEAAAMAADLSACSWGTARTVTVGPDSLACIVMRGSCAREGAPIDVAVLRADADATLVVGAWREPEDRVAVLSSMRSLSRSAGNVAACCDALDASASAAAADVKPRLSLAAQLCYASTDAAATESTIRGALAGLPVPEACR